MEKTLFWRLFFWYSFSERELLHLHNFKKLKFNGISNIDISVYIKYFNSRYITRIRAFLPAKWFKCRVDKFYLFFDPWFFSEEKIGETEYGIGWLPFGGYVKIAGMVDESMDTEQLKTTCSTFFRSKPAWQRLIIMLGGIFVNLILVWAIYTGLNLSVSEKYHDLAKFENGIAVSEEGAKMGLMNGDKILKIDGKPAVRMENSMINMLLANEITVLRNGKKVSFVHQKKTELLIF